MSVTLEERRRRLEQEKAAYEEELQMRRELELRVRRLHASRDAIALEDQYVCIAAHSFRESHACLGTHVRPKPRRCVNRFA